MIETAQAADATAILTVTDARMERILRAGWPLDCIAAPQRLGNTMALAGFLPVSAEALSAMYRRAEVIGPAIGQAGDPTCGRLIQSTRLPLTEQVSGA